MPYPIQTIGAVQPAETRLAPGYVAWGLVSTASMLLCVWHGYKRNDSVGWALVWGFFGALFPIVTPVIALAQGFGERRRQKNPARRARRSRLNRARRARRARRR